MKIALITDLHFGIRNDSQVFLEHTRNFFEQTFFPYCKAHGITSLIILGDVFDRRKYINISTAHAVRGFFTAGVASHFTSCKVIAGNHDVYHTNSLSVNSLQEILDPNIFYIITEPEEHFGGRMLFLPWICSDNEVRCFEAIEKSKAEVCFAHLQLKGFEMHVGQYSETGFDMALFSKFKLVATGHFHHRSSKLNIHYLGSPYQMTWADYDDPKGFHIFDTETLKLDYHQNDKEIFYKIVYDDRNKTLEEVLNWDFEKFHNCYLKILVKHKQNPYWLDMFVENAEKFAADIKIVEDVVYLDSEVTVEECESTTAILKKCVEETNIQKSKKELENLLIELYNEAQAQEV